ncbi:hypothetical protein M0802_010482 [Mischocyttarus mexicanus]|nr:hypothetical protein M0802_010482 [Mischocyttarus mexicanus]
MNGNPKVTGNYTNSGIETPKLDSTWFGLVWFSLRTNIFTYAISQLLQPLASPPLPFCNSLLQNDSRYYLIFVLFVLYS